MTNMETDITDNLVDEVIKSCPFCGGAPRLFKNENKYSNVNFVVVCQNEKCFCQPNSEYCGDILDAIQQWNQREK